ncbi:MAG: nucleoside monophosphate kinase [Candidatus Saccharibacteria bacterium]|nr:nucleoside monophosphate kinase [Candidatus Saccharibacteria bacterium]
MEQNIEIIKEWLGTGSINIFGMPFSGKDTIGARLAETFGGKLLSSGSILRDAQERDEKLREEMNSGALASTDKFRTIVLPYFANEDLKEFPLILSSVGRWEGEERPVMEAAANAGHPIKAAILLNISREEMEKRRKLALESLDRGARGDDLNEEALELRIKEFNEKTLPVLEVYKNEGLLVEVDAKESRDEVFQNTIEALLKVCK